MKRRKFSKEFKAKVALEAIKGQRTTANELAQEFDVHADVNAVIFQHACKAIAGILSPLASVNDLWRTMAAQRPFQRTDAKTVIHGYRVSPVI